MKKLLIATIILSLSFCSIGYSATKAVQWDTLLSGLQDDAGLPSSLWTVTVYENDGSSTTSTIWEDASKTTTAANPITLDEYGTKERYFDGIYRILVKDADGVTIRDTDDVRIIGFVDFGGLYVDVFNTYGNAASDIQDAIDDTAAAGGGRLYFGGTFTIAENVVGDSSVSWVIGNPAVLSISSGFVVSPNAYVESGDYQFISGAGTFTFDDDYNPIIHAIWSNGTAGKVTFVNDVFYEEDINVSGSIVVDGSLNILNVDVSGTVTANKLTDGTASLESGSLTGIVNIDASGTITANAFVGDLTGNVVGDLTGNVVGDLTGNVVGEIGRAHV